MLWGEKRCEQVVISVRRIFLRLTAANRWPKENPPFRSDGREAREDAKTHRSQKKKEKYTLSVRGKVHVPRACICISANSSDPRLRREFFPRTLHGAGGEMGGI